MKHGDMYTAKDGRELMAVRAPKNACRPVGFPACELGDPIKHEHENLSCREYGTDGPPCTFSMIFVKKEKYLEYKLLGTTESSG
jgi:hypothetical protein